MPDFATNTHETTRQLNRSHGSFELALAPVILGLLGLWLDRTLGTVPLFLVLFTVCGFAGAGIKIYYTYRYQMEQHQTEVAWKGHESSESFRAESSARTERLSVGSAEDTDPVAEFDSATNDDVSATNRVDRG